ncbi:uncharacterized protein LOC117647324 [Thrips palmi]|uniref:Uncharacterized protein LOC117647324 n=1 Tax=Thrips palmi TaxID=161013 RepID=A0A6P8Z4B6_THRPL|nr:uncharacterized protein LOC117647324 [Thrips palmi]
MASKRKSPPTKLQELVELVPLCEASVNAVNALFAKGVELDHHEIPAKRKRSGDDEDRATSSPTTPVDKCAPGLNNNNNSITNNNIHSKRSMDHVLKKLTFKMMKDDMEAVTPEDHLCPPEEPNDETAASMQLRERQLAAMLRQLQVSTLLARTAEAKQSVSPCPAAPKSRSLAIRKHSLAGASR